MARRIALAVFIAAATPAVGEDASDPDVRIVLDRFESLRPSVEELAWYTSTGRGR